MLKDKIREDFTNARKEGDAEKKNALEAIIAFIIMKEKTETGHVVTDEEVMTGITKEIKIQEEIKTMWAGKNSDKEEEAVKKIEILTSYLPKQLTEDEVMDLIRQADVYTDASAKTKGMIIKTIMPQIAGKFDKSKVNPLVEKYLSEK